MHKTFHTSPKLIVKNWVIDNNFESVHRSAMIKIIKSVFKYFIFKSIV